MKDQVIRIAMFAILCLMAAPALSAQEWQPSPEWSPPMDAAPARPGTLKVQSTPIRCTIVFRSQTLEKTEAVMTIPDIPPGQYSVIFRTGGREITRQVQIQPGETTVVVGVIDPPTLPSEVRARTFQGASGQTSTVSGLPVVARPMGGGVRVEDADTAFRLAEILRNAANPFMKPSRYREAVEIYRNILHRWPESDKVELCYYNIGLCSESTFMKEYARAIAAYKLLVQYNPDTDLDPRWRIANLYEHRIKDIDQALHWYKQTSQYSNHANLRDMADQRINYIYQRREEEARRAEEARQRALYGTEVDRTRAPFGDPRHEAPPAWQPERPYTEIPPWQQRLEAVE